MPSSEFITHQPPKANTIERLSQRLIVKNPELKDFFRWILEEGIYLYPVGNPKVWSQRLNTLIRFFLQSYSQEELGNMQEKLGAGAGARTITRQGVSLQILKIINEWWELYTAEDNTPFPDESFGGLDRITHRIAVLYQRGMAPQDIWEKVGVNHTEAASRRVTLAKYGLDISATFLTEKKLLRQKAYHVFRHVADSDQLYDMLDELGAHIWQIVFRESKKPDSERCLFSLTHLLRQQGYRHVPFHEYSDIIDRLKQMGIVIFSIPARVKDGNMYCFVPFSHRDAFIQIAAEQQGWEKFKINPVQQITGKPLPAEDMPNFWEAFRAKDEKEIHRDILGIFIDLGISYNPRDGNKLKDFFDPEDHSCPPIFAYTHPSSGLMHYSCFAKDIPAVTAYLRRRWLS